MSAIGGIPGLLVAAMFAAVVLVFEMWLTSKIGKLPLEHVAGSRMIILDHILSSDKQAPRSRPTLEDAEVVDAEVLETPERKHLER